MPTLKEVAKHAGVSTATVSRVLSRTSYVNKETRERILQAIEELGYTPNLAARALSKGRTYIIGIIYPYNHDLLFYDPFMSSVIQGIETVCTDRGYNLLLNTPRIPVKEAEQFHRLMRSGYLDGVITFETIPGIPARELVREHGYLCVSIGSAKPDYIWPNSVNVDDYEGARQIAAYLIAQGHRKFGVISVDPAQLTSALRRLHGYEAAFREAGLDFEGVPIVNGEFDVESGYAAAGELLSISRPTAVLCLNDRMAMGAIRRMQAEGLSVPNDITVVGFDDIPGADYFNPPLTTVRQPAQQMGSTAANLLFELIDAQYDKESAPVLFQPELVIRASSAPPKGGDG